MYNNNLTHVYPTGYNNFCEYQFFVADPTVGNVITWYLNYLFNYQLPMDMQPV